MLQRLTGLIGKASAPLLAKVAAASAGLMVAMLVAIVTLSALLLDAQAKLGAAQQAEGTASAQAAGNKRAAVQLAQRLADEVNARALDQRAQARAQAEWERTMAAVRERAADERIERERLYVDDDECAAMRRCTVCGPIADQLRQSRARLRSGDG